MNMVVSEARIESWNPALELKLAPLVTLDDDQLFAFCQLNRDLRIERDAEGVLVLMAPAGGLSSARNLELCRQLANWTQRDGRGMAFDSSVGFILPMSRAQESEADRIGLVLMALAGYDPREAIVVWERMHAANTGRRQAEWLSTHPADTTRLADIRRWLPEAMKYYRPRN